MQAQDAREEVPEQTVLLDIESGIAELFRNARHVARDYAALAHPDLQPTGFHVLRLVAHLGPVQAGTLVLATGLDKSAVSRQLRTLRDLGFIETQPDPDDGRSSYVVITPLGERRIRAVQRQVRRDYEVRLADWTPAELASFARLLTRFNEVER
ncbi:hypothetical protein BH09ACT6_BH09ACT6_22450 [soil metagenome]